MTQIFAKNNTDDISLLLIFFYELVVENPKNPTKFKFFSYLATKHIWSELVSQVVCSLLHSPTRQPPHPQPCLVSLLAKQMTNCVF